MKLKSLWGKPSIKSAYEAVIIGGGIHGLATAHFLARDHGIQDTAGFSDRTSLRRTFPSFLRSSFSSTGFRGPSRSGSCPPGSRPA